MSGKFVNENAAAFEVKLDELRRAKRNPDIATAAELFDAGVAAERERCAKLCETLMSEWADNHGMELCADAIRKGETP